MIVLKYKYSTNKSTKYYISALWTVEVIDYCCFFEGTSCECRETSVSSSTFAALSVPVVCTSNVSSVICRCRLQRHLSLSSACRTLWTSSVTRLHVERFQRHLSLSSACRTFWPSSVAFVLCVEHLDIIVSVSVHQSDQLSLSWVIFAYLSIGIMFCSAAVKSTCWAMIRSQLLRKLNIY